MITDKTVWKSQESILYPTFLPLEFVHIVLVAFVGIIFVTGAADALSVSFIILSHAIAGVSEIPFK